MSIFAGTPDYSHIIWAPQRFPEGEGGINSFVSGVGMGLETGMGFKAAKTDWKKRKAEAEEQGVPFDEPKPNVFKSYFGFDEWQNQQAGADGQGQNKDKQQEDPSQQPQGTQLGMSGGSFAPVNTGQAVSYLGGVTQQMNAMIDSQQDLLSKLNGGYNA